MEAFDSVSEGLSWGNHNGSGSFDFYVFNREGYEEVEVFQWRGLAKAN